MITRRVGRALKSVIPSRVDHEVLVNGNALRRVKKDFLSCRLRFSGINQHFPAYSKDSGQGVKINRSRVSYQNSPHYAYISRNFSTLQNTLKTLVIPSGKEQMAKKNWLVFPSVRLNSNLNRLPQFIRRQFVCIDLTFSGDLRPRVRTREQPSFC